MTKLTRRAAILSAAALPPALGMALARPALAQAGDPFKVGLILPMTGPFASTGRQIDAAVKAWLRANPAPVAGKRFEILLRDDTGVAPDVTRRLAQELVVRERVRALAGFGLTPLALSAAPIATEAKVPMLVMAAATSIIPQRSPYIVRTSFTLPQAVRPMADWAAKNGIKSVVTMVTDFAPGLDSEKAFKETFTAAGGTIAGEIRTPLRNPDYAPFLQRVRDLKPDALFIFVPSGEGSALIKQFSERGLKEAGIRLIGTGDVLDDDILNDMGEAVVGAVTSHHYSTAHESPENAAFREAFRAVAPEMRPNFMAAGGWDGMHLLAEALRRTNGDTDGTKLVEAMKGQSWTSPRGPVSIDPATREMVQDIYIRRTERRDGQLWNIEFDRIQGVKDAA